MQRQVGIVEVSPRDGLQNEATLVETADKLALVRRALAAGVRRIEVTSFVNPRRVPQMADAEALMTALGPQPGIGLIGLALNERGAERALAAGCTEVNFVVVASETFNRRNQGVSIAETLATWGQVARRAQAAGARCTLTIGASFGCPFEGEVAPQAVLDLARRGLEAGPDELAFADTIGCGVPSQARALLQGARALAPALPLRCHFHNTRGTGLANVLAAVEAGADAIDASIGGTGGCPFAPTATGNVATEDVVYMLDRMGIATGLSLDALIDAAGWLTGVLGHACPAAAVSRAGTFPPVAAA